MDLALFRLPDGQKWIGEGPFTEAATPPDEVCFYVNDFTLSDPKPWKIPARLTTFENLPPQQAPHIRWKTPSMERFKMVFRRIRKDVREGLMLKMVPAVCEDGQLMDGSMAGLLPNVVHAPEGLWGYVALWPEKGFLGATPELLLDIEGRRLKTMALAGTAKPRSGEHFMTDTKEIQEHEIVAEFLRGALAPLGELQQTSREATEATGLTHFRTSMTVELHADPDLNALIRLLHPTPAVGCLPRDDDHVAKLMEYRNKLGVPPFFGAPFGLKTRDQFHAVVSIRGVGWQENTVMLPSGCGVVGGSAFDHEWRELRLKRQAVAHLLGI